MEIHQTCEGSLQMQRPKDCRSHEGRNLCSDVPKLVPAGTRWFLNAYWLTENKNTKTKGKLGSPNKQTNKPRQIHGRVTK